MKDKEERVTPVGWNLTTETKEHLYRIAAYLRTKRTRAVLQLIDMLLDELVHDQGFRAFAAAFDRLHDDTKGKNAYTSFYIPESTLKKFEDTMYDFGFIDRSPFLRLIINWVYNNHVRPIEEDILPKIEADITSLGYKIKSVGPILEGDIYIHIENPAKKSSRKTKTGK